jgi:hypothetical protein
LIIKQLAIKNENGKVSENWMGENERGRRRGRRTIGVYGWK